MPSPYRDLSHEESATLFNNSSSGKSSIFVGELGDSLNLPNTATRHVVHAGRYFEVLPEQLIDVAKHIAVSGESIEKILERAYAIICEAHLVSRSIEHWNKGQSRHWLSEKLDALIKKHANASNREEQTIPKKPLLKDFLSQLREKNLSEDKAERLFNKFIKETVRKEEFLDHVPWNHHQPHYDQKLHNLMIEKGWFTTVHIGTALHYLAPESTKKPEGNSRRKLKEGDHPTRPYWETKRVWWPEANKESVKELKDEWLIDGNSRFQSVYTAGKALEQFNQWLDVQDAFDIQHSKPKKTPKRKEGTGQFVKKNEKSI